MCCGDLEYKVKIIKMQLTFYVYMQVSKGAKIRNRYNQVPDLTQDTNGKVTASLVEIHPLVQKIGLRKG